MVHGYKKMDYSLQGDSFIRACKKFLAIYRQGGLREPEFALYKEDIKAEKSRYCLW
jgi:hypothetical protein